MTVKTNTQSHPQRSIKTTLELTKNHQQTIENLYTKSDKNIQNNKLLLKKRCVFSRHLKHCKDPAHFIVSGSSFHSFGAAAAKDRLPYAVDVLTCFNKYLAPDLNERVGLCSVRSSEMYFGANPWSALYVNSKTLNTTRLRTGSQCSSCRTGVMW